MIIYDLKVFLQFLRRVSYPPNFSCCQGAESLEDAEARASMLELTVELSASAQSEVEEEMSGICVGIWKMVSNLYPIYKILQVYVYIYI